MVVDVKVKRLDPTAQLPQFAHKDDACADLYANEQVVIEPGHRYLVSTGIALQLPSGYEAQIRPRSGLAIKYGIMILNSPGTIDTGYRGEIKIIVHNTSDTNFEIVPSLRIAQIAIRPIPDVQFHEVDELVNSQRGTGGFGSTGDLN